MPTGQPDVDNPLTEAFFLVILNFGILAFKRYIHTCYSIQTEQVIFRNMYVYEKKEAMNLKGNQEGNRKLEKRKGKEEML